MLVVPSEDVEKRDGMFVREEKKNVGFVIRYSNLVETSVDVIVICVFYAYWCINDSMTTYL
jgi:hypothetical protein